MDHSDYSVLDEGRLLELMAKDSAAAFDVLYERHWETLYRSACWLLRDRAAAMDIVQDVFVWLWEHRREQTIGSLGPYLKAAVRFKIANHYRSGQVREEAIRELLAVQPSDSPLAADQQAAVRELERIINEAIHRLPVRCRQVFLLSREGRLTNQQIADRLGISINTVETQMRIALQKIRAAVEPYRLGLFLLLTLYR